MARKRIPPDDEIEALAAILRPLVKRGETIRPFLRRNQTRLREIVDEESWASLALVLTKLGMTYSTGRAWTAHTIRVEMTRTIAPRKRERDQQKTAALEPHAPLPSAPQPAPHAAATAQTPPESGPRFKPATLLPAPGSAPHPLAANPAPKFKAFSLKPSAPPQEPTPAELHEREEIQKRFFPSS